MTKNEILKLKQANHQHFDNALHVQFHHTQYELVAAVGEEKLHLPAGLLEAWKKNIELETEINKQSMLSVHTQALTAKDKERDALLSHFFGMIRAQMISPVQSMSQAAKKVFAALKPYFNIQGDGAARQLPRGAIITQNRRTAYRYGSPICLYIQPRCGPIRT